LNPKVLFGARFEILAEITINNMISWDMTPCRLVDVHTDFSEESTASIFKVEE
jgi:hypothetical protein